MIPFFYALLFELKILFYFFKKVISSKLLVEKKKKNTIIKHMILYLFDNMEGKCQILFFQMNKKVFLNTTKMM
ncbi:hypothetical protein CTM74_10190 [Fusobacterium pseudoperiodonticum]|uniref:Uncharacterized protein n=1 Tax=Fusobacterium pseudoperiodonticum TaxID=2663009 RepID=A0AAD0AMA6_9FUSO|nr:hypothetical protein CTM64_02140 [Fusobacterium pseudoperiodonticum]ATV62163.1 hypothetical protein CTM74_10190 [Fusobacterium pseudoperiodonticum]